MKKYIPKSKDDFEAINFLNTCSFELVKEDALNLLTWMQDMHWEVAHGISLYFRTYINDIKNELIVILKSNDIEWKFAILNFLIAESTLVINEDLMVIIKRIALEPTEAEIVEDLHIVAMRI
jgi:hypothetical protein